MTIDVRELQKLPQSGITRPDDFTRLGLCRRNTLCTKTICQNRSLCNDTICVVAKTT